MFADCAGRKAERKADLRGFCSDGCVGGSAGAGATTGLLSQSAPADTLRLLGGGRTGEEGAGDDDMSTGSDGTAGVGVRLVAGAECVATGDEVAAGMREESRSTSISSNSSLSIVPGLNAG